MHQSANTKPAFQIKKLPDDFVTTTKAFTVDKKSGRLVAVEKEVKGGYLAFFPNGHSVRITSEEELNRLALNETPDKIDMESGVVFRTEGKTRDISLEELVNRKTKVHHKDQLEGVQ